MAAVKELLKTEADGTLSFGDYTLAGKTKLDGFEFQGDIYKVKTFAEITKLEKNGKESGFTIVPMRLFINDRGLAKIVIGIGRGKKEYDKRQSIKEREDKRSMARMFEK